MPRLETPIGRDGPIIDVRIWIGPEHEQALKARGLQAPRPLSVPGLLEHGGADDSDPAGFGPGDWPSRPRLGEAPILGFRAGERDAPVYLMRMTFGPIEAPDPPKWRIISSVGVTVVSPGDSRPHRSGFARDVSLHLRRPYYPGKKVSHPCTY